MKRNYSLEAKGRNFMLHINIKCQMSETPRQNTSEEPGKLDSTDLKTGLSRQEADSRIQQFGLNALEQVKKFKHRGPVGRVC